MTGPDRLLQLLRELIGRGRTWRGSQSYLCSQLGAPLRTLQRWTAELRKANKIFTRRWMDARGYRSLNIYSIVDSGGSKVVKVVQGFSSTTTNGSKWSFSEHPYGKNRQDQKPSPTQRLVDIHVRKIAPTTSQPGLFEPDELDDRRTVSDNRQDRKVSNRTTKGSPVSRSVTYWLAGRVERPPGYVIASVGRAMKKCFDMSPDLTEQGMRAVIDSLMSSGLDVSPRHYVAACGVQKPSATRRDYSKSPLWKHRPKRSSMTPERAKEVSDRSERLAAASRSRSLTLGSPSLSPTSPGVTAPTPSPVITAPTANDSTRMYGRWLLGLPMNEVSAVERPIDRRPPSGSMIERTTGQAPRTLDEQIEHDKYQEAFGADMPRTSAYGSVMARLQARRGTGGDS